MPAAGHHLRLGPGTSRFIEPKRHFRKPLELSPLVAIDRERCILCYRCVRFSQEISEDYQLILPERGAHAYVDLRRPPVRRAVQPASTMPSLRPMKIRPSGAYANEFGRPPSPA